MTEQIEIPTPESTSSVFLRDVAVLDCALFDPGHGVIGQTWLVDVQLTAPIDEKGFIHDFGALKDLLSREVYDGFAAAIAERDARGEKVDQQFVGIKKAEIVGAEVAGGVASVTVRFLSELITAVRDRSGVVLSGDPQRVAEVTDVWTFTRDVSSRNALDNPNWRLDETQAPN